MKKGGENNYCNCMIASSSVAILEGLMVIWFSCRFPLRVKYFVASANGRGLVCIV